MYFFINPMTIIMSRDLFLWILNLVSLSRFKLLNMENCLILKIYIFPQVHTYTHIHIHMARTKQVKPNKTKRVAAKQPRHNSVLANGSDSHQIDIRQAITDAAAILNEEMPIEQLDDDEEVLHDEIEILGYSLKNGKRIFQVKLVYNEKSVTAWVGEQWFGFKGAEDSVQQSSMKLWTFGGIAGCSESAINWYVEYVTENSEEAR